MWLIFKLFMIKNCKNSNPIKIVNYCLMNYINKEKIQSQWKTSKKKVVILNLNQAVLILHII